MNTAAKPAPQSNPLVRRKVNELLASSPAFNGLPPDKQREIAHNTARVASYLASPEGIKAHKLSGAVTTVPAGGLIEEVDFPNFVANLIDGVFHAIVDSSIQQMEAFGELLKNVSATVDQFAKDNVSDARARKRLATNRQQLLASMVLMGINRIVVTN